MAINKPKIQIQVDIPNSINQINADLSQLEKQLKPINVSLNINSDTIKAQTVQLQTQINNIEKTSSTGIKIPIDFNVSANEIKAQLERIVGQIRNGDKGTVINYKVNLDKDNNFDSVMLKYRNEANEVTESLLKLGEAGNWNETIKSVSQNIEQTTRKAEQLTVTQQKQANSIVELTEKYKLLQIQTSNAGIDSLNSKNISGIQNALNSNNVEQATHYLNLLRTEYQELNAEMSKKLPQNAIDNMSDRASQLETKIGSIESKFSNINLGNMSGFSEQVSNANKNVSQLKTNLDRYNQAKIGQDKVDAFNKLDNSVKQTKKQVDDLFKSQKALENLAGTHNRFQAFLNDNVKVAQKLPDEVNRIKASLKSLNSETDMTKLTTGLQNVKGQISSLRATAKKDGLLGRTFFGELGNDIKKMFTWTVGGGAIFGTINTFKKMIDTARDLDKVATNVQIASGKSNAEIQKLMSTYSQMGETLGATTVEIGNSADEFLRQGKSVAETNQLIKDSMMLSKLGEVDSAEATKYLTSAMKGYNISVKDSIGIVDKLTKVDQISATSAGGLAEGMSKTASMASLAGVSIDKLLGMLATVGETTQKSMDQVGTSFQAMFSRMGNVKAGKFVDDITGESLNDVESVLKKIGISLRDSSGQFRNFGTVLDEIGDKWKSYDSVEKNAIATAIAGSKQRENFTVLMEQYGTALKYQESSANSAGTATQKMSVYTDSLEAKTKAATAAFEKLSKAVVNGDIFKGIIDAGGTLSKVLSSIVESGHGLPAIITSISAIRSMMGKDAGKEYAHLLRVA